MSLYQRLETLSAERHRDLLLSPTAHYGFAADTAQVPLVPDEISEAAKHFPVVFTRRETQVQAVALLSLQPEDNVFVDDDGRWLADYVPAWFRRYPFAFGPAPEAAGEGLAVLIDRDAPQLSGSAGRPLFVREADGRTARGPATADAVAFLDRFRRASQRAEARFAPLAAHDVLVARNLDVYADRVRSRRVAGLHIVDRDRLAALADAELAAWARSGLLEAVHAHWHSLTNFRRLALQDDA